MNLKEIIAKVTGLEQRAEAALKAELETIKLAVNDTIAKLTADLATAQASIVSLTTAKTDAEAAVQELTGKLSTANKLELDSRGALLAHLATLPGHEDYKEGGKLAGATLAELISAEQNATNTALAATGVKIANLPSGGAQPPASGRKTATREQFEAMSHPERDAFFSAGGKLTE